MTAHIRLKESFRQADTEAILDRIKVTADKQFDIEHTTIEFD